MYTYVICIQNYSVKEEPYTLSLKASWQCPCGTVSLRWAAYCFYHLFKSYEDVCDCKQVWSLACKKFTSCFEPGSDSRPCTLHWRLVMLSECCYVLLRDEAYVAPSLITSHLFVSPRKKGCNNATRWIYLPSFVAWRTLTAWPYTSFQWWAC